ncbi:MAG: DUF503 domain-containing protein [Planctomycetes bacterium]|nr:DUF503 domain-containing protein [Planctomycetota bacterium]
MARRTRPAGGSSPAGEMAVAVVQADLLVPGCLSLKEKRSVVKGLLERARSRFNASVAEVGAQDLLQRATVGAALVANDRRLLSSEAEALLAFLAGCPDVQVLDRQVEIL